MMNKKFWSAVLIFCTAVWAGNGWALELSDVIKKYKNSIADVVFELKYDEKGDAPTAVGIYCGACSAFHDNNLANFLADQRDLLVSGFIIGSDEVFVPAMLIDPVGIKGIFVNFNGRKIPAQATAFYPDQGAVKLKTQIPLPGAEVLKFVPYKKDGKFFSYSRIRELGRWVERLRGFSVDGVESADSSGRFSSIVPGNSLILNSAGEVVAMQLNNNESLKHLPWYTNYTKWRMVPAARFAAMRKALQKHLLKSLQPVTVYFREWTLSRRERLMNTVPLREACSYAFMLPGGRLFMPLLTSPQQNGLIEKIVLHTANGDIDCRIAGVMRKFGGMLLVPEAKKTLNIPVISENIVPLTAELGEIIWSVKVGIYPKKLQVNVYSDILIAAGRTFHNIMSAAPLKKGLPELLFSLNGKLLAMNLSVRAFNYNRVLPFADAAAVAGMLNDPRELLPIQAISNPFDAVGYLGVEYQALNRELVRSVNLEHLTNGGREGLLISYVYPGSPAEKIGLQAGDILLKLIVPECGAPISLTGKEFAHSQEQQFPWKNLDNIPEMYFSEIPEPWKGVKNPLAKQLANIGIGQQIGIIAICRGKVVRKELKIANAPVYFEIAPAFRSGALGLEVKDMTFEVRRYFRMNTQTPGVIVSDVYAGSAAAVAGLRPFEIITAVDDKAVYSAGDFKKAVAGKNEVRLAVKRLAANRVVTVKAAAGPRL